MNPVDLLLRAEAAVVGRVQKRRMYRHSYIDPMPLAIAAIQMAGEPHALWGALIGPDPRNPRLIVAPEPRNRDIVFAALAELADVVCEAVNAAARDRVTISRRGEARSVCRRAPQLLVANNAVADLLGRLGRRMRTAGFGGRISVSADVNIAGAHLGFYADAHAHPGSALTLVASELLARQAWTGQSDLEDAHLGTQLAWWDPAIVERVKPGVLNGADVSNLHGAEAAAAIEQVPMGVLTDPRDDNETLLEAVERFNTARAGQTDRATVRRLQGEIAGLLDQTLRPTWRALWEAHRLLIEEPEAPGAQRRWEADVQRFTWHVDYLARGGRVASVDSARRAAMLLADRERAQAALEADEVLEDPLATAAALAAGQAIEGRVIDLDDTYREPGPSGRLLSRPRITMLSPDECPFPVGTELWWTERPDALRAQVVATDTAVAGTRVVLQVTKGMKGELPAPGAHVVFSTYTTSWVPPARLPRSTPWTHVPDVGGTADDGRDLEEGPSVDAVLQTEGAP